VFGMGTGVAPSLEPPGKLVKLYKEPRRECASDNVNREVLAAEQNSSNSDTQIGQADRPISTDELNASRRLHLPPINLVISQGSSGRPHLEGGFPLRCLQRLSFPYVATQRCHWRDNWYTRGTSVPVLSY
jgi:hypothetical protein